MYVNCPNMLNDEHYQVSNSNRHTPDNSNSSASDGLGSSYSASPSSDSSSRVESPCSKPAYSTPASANYYYYGQRQHAAYYPNYQNQYEQASIPNQQYNYQTQYPTKSTGYDDSNYYSRNCSINQTTDSFNDSWNVKPAIPVTKPAAVLKFSIDWILGLSKTKEKTAEVNQPDVDDNEEEDGECYKMTANAQGASKKRSRGKMSANELAANKRIRTIFTQEQLDQLEIEFNRQQYMVGSERSYLANKLNLSEAQVKIWFQNRRIKWRKTVQGSGGSNTTNGANVDGEFGLNHSYSNDSQDEE